VGDAVGAMVDLMQHPDTAGQVYNIGNPNEITIEDLAHKVIDLSDSISTIKYVPYSEAYVEGFEDIRSRVPNIKKIQELTGFSPKVQLDEIIQEVISYRRKNPGQG